MIVPFGQSAAQMQLRAAAQELESCNQVIQRHGITLSPQDIQALVVGRLDALQESERVEFGGGVAKDVVLAFSGSAYVSQSTFVLTVLELQELFYQFKNESLEQITDDELIETMRSLYDNVAHGDLERLSEALLDGLSRHVREEVALDDPGSLAPRRMNVADWTDDEYAPAWEGASWLDD